MPWSNKQKGLFVRAAKAAGCEDSRYLILGQPQFNGRAKMPDGSISSRSARLTNADFETAMAVVEEYDSGQLSIKTRGRTKYHAGRWAAKAANGGNRQGHEIDRLINSLKLTDDPKTGQRVIAEDGQGLAGIINQATQGRHSSITTLGKIDRSKVINAMANIDRRLNHQGSTQ